MCSLSKFYYLTEYSLTKLAKLNTSFGKSERVFNKARMKERERERDR